MKSKIPSLIGAVASFVLFLLYGAVPGILMGGYMGLATAGAILGTPVDPSLVSKVLTVGGMALGLVASMFLFLVVGAFVGTVVGYGLQKAASLTVRQTAQQGK